MADKRIIELTNEKLILGDGDYAMIDSNEGTYKFKLKRILDLIPAPDTTLSIAGRAADAAKTGEELADVKRDLNDKANMTVGSSRQLLSEKYLLDEEPYHFRASGGDGSDRVEECIVGGSVAWNQHISDTADFTVEASGNQTHSFTPSVEFVVGHKYIAVITQSVALTSATRNRFGYNIGGSYAYQNRDDLTAGQKSWIFTPSTSGSGSLVFWCHTPSTTVTFNRCMLIDLTTLFGSTIADYIYSLEQSTAGAGVAWFRKYFPDDYYPYSAPTLKHVEGVSAKQIRDADDNVTAIYPLDSSLTLRGIPKLTDGKMWFDGDKYLPSGQVARNTILRAYQSGDESLANAITDGTNTVVYSANASTEEAAPYTALQTLDPHGTEEFVSTGIVPVGHYSKYLENLRSKIEGLPRDFSTLIAPTEATYKATQNYTVGSLLIVDNILYKVTSAIANGGTITPNTNCTATTLSAVIAAL